jgi:hypothetical protein
MDDGLLGGDVVGWGFFSVRSGLGRVSVVRGRWFLSLSLSLSLCS